MMTFEFTPTFGQAYRALLWLSIRRPITWLTLVLFPGTVTAMLIVTIYVYDRSPNLAELGIAVLAFAFVPCHPAFIVWFAGRQHRGLRRFAFTADAIELSVPPFDTRIAWDGVLRARQSREFFFIFISAGAALFVPVHVVKSTGQLEAFREFLIAKLAGRARLLSSGLEIRSP